MHVDESKSSRGRQVVLCLGILAILCAGMFSYAVHFEMDGRYVVGLWKQSGSSIAAVSNAISDTITLALWRSGIVAEPPTSYKFFELMELIVECVEVVTGECTPDPEP